MFRKKSPEEKVLAEIETIRAERLANEQDMIGLVNRPRYGRAKERLVGMGPAAVEPLIRVVADMPTPPPDYEDRTDADELNAGVASDAADVLAEIGDPRAVPVMISRIDHFFGLHYALAKTAEGVQAMIDIASDRNADDGARYSAVSGLGAASASKDAALETLLQLVITRADFVLIPAITSVGILGDGDPRAVDALREIVADESVDQGARITAEKRLAVMAPAQ